MKQLFLCPKVVLITNIKKRKTINIRIFYYITLVSIITFFYLIKKCYFRQISSKIWSNFWSNDKIDLVKFDQKIFDQKFLTKWPNIWRFCGTLFITIWFSAFLHLNLLNSIMKIGDKVLLKFYKNVIIDKHSVDFQQILLDRNMSFRSDQT